MRRFALGFVLALLVGCDDHQAEESASLDEAVQGRPEAKWRVADEPMLSIGLAQGPDEYLFRGVTAARLPNGGIVAAVEGMDEVRRFGPDGRHLWTSGRPGEGPGEFRGVRLLTGCTSAQSIVAYDYRNDRVTVLDADGNPVQNARTMWDGVPLYEIRCGADQRFVVSNSTEDPPDSGPYRWNNSVGVAVASGSDFEVKMLRSDMPGAERVRVVLDSDQSVGFPRTWGKDLEFVATDEGVWLGTGDDYELELIDWSGATARRIRWSGPDQAVADEHVEAHRDEIRRYYSESSFSDWEARFHSQWEEEAKYLPSTFPSFSRVLLSDDGNLWVEHFRRPGAARREWVVFAPTGEWVAAVDLPARMVVEDVGADWVLARTTDELNVERIELYALVADRPAPVSGQEVQRLHRAEGSEAWSLRLEEVLAIGSMEGDDSFGRVMDIAWDGRGRILVADDLGPHVKVFGADGSYVRTIGRAGEGPGEFSQPWQLAVDASDSLYVWDAGRSRILVFSPDHQFNRSFLVSSAWVVASMEVPAPDRIVLAAFGTGEKSPVKVLDKEGAVLRQAGRAVDLVDLAGYEGSLLGGSLARIDGGYAYSNKSPWAMTWLDRDLRPVRTCVGPSDWTTDPSDVVLRTEQGTGLACNRYVYSASVVGLPGGMALNTILDPVADRRVLHLVTRECAIKSEIALDFPVMPILGRGDLVAAVRSLDYPEVVLYRVITSNRSPT